MIDYVYDPLNRLTEANYPTTSDYYQYSYGAVGNREWQGCYVGGLWTADDYTYDIANRLETVNGVTYTWDDNGNLLNDGVNTYDYDSANRMISLSSPSTTVAYTYNRLNDSLQETAAGGSTTTFTMDLNAGLRKPFRTAQTTICMAMAALHRLAPAPNTS